MIRSSLKPLETVCQLTRPCFRDHQFSVAHLHWCRGGATSRQVFLIQRWPSKRSVSLPHVPYFDAICPPSTINVVPVMYDAISDARNITACATSSGSPPRPSGMCLKYSDKSFGLAKLDAVSRVRMRPGHTAFTRMPYGPSSFAAVCSNPNRPALLAL